MSEGEDWRRAEGGERWPGAAGEGPLCGSPRVDPHRFRGEGLTRVPREKVPPMSASEGVHSAGAARMQAALAEARAEDDAGDGGAFFSLRFGAEHGVVPMAEQLLAALAARGGRGKIVNMSAGGDIDTEVFQSIERCGTFLVFGSAKYGEDTGNQACTYYEYKHAFAKKKKIVLIRMIPFDQEFENLQARVIFNANRLVLPWMLGTPMPADLPDRILEVMGSSAPDVPPKPQPAAAASSLGLPPSQPAPTPTPTGGVGVAQVYEAAGAVDAMLADVQLSAYAAAIGSEGYEYVVDLLDAEQAELEELMTKLGMKRPERRRFERALAMHRDAASVGTMTGGGEADRAGLPEASARPKEDDEAEPQPESAAEAEAASLALARQRRAEALATLPSAEATEALTIMREHMRDEEVCQQACRALANLMVSSDARKQQVADAGGAASIVGAMRGHGGSAAVQEQACKALANLMVSSDALRQQVADAGGAASIVGAMRGHGGSAAVQEQACRALENMTFGGPSCLAAIRSADAQAALRFCVERYPTAAKDARVVLGKL